MAADMFHADFSPETRALLSRLVTSRGASSPGYDPASPPYAVFDCDNTTLFRDVQDVVLTEQLARLTFGVSAEALGEVLSVGVDIPEALDLLHDAITHLDQLQGSLGHVDADARADLLLTFGVEMRALYHTIGDHLGDAFACSWVTRLYTGLTPARVHDLARSAYAAELARPVSYATQRSASGFSGRAGAVDVTWPQGLRPLEPMRALFETLQREGFEVWICSASFEHIVRAAVCGGPLGYPVRASHVMGMRLELDSTGRFLSARPDDCVDTHGHGKTLNITRYIASRLGHGPALVAGDSNGDAHMLDAFPDAARLVFDRGIGGRIGALAALAGDPDARVAVQARDESRGVLIPRSDSILTAP